jgi:hypothetical protein
MASNEVRLTVNDTPIELDRFVRGYIDHVVEGMLASLKGTGEIRGVDLSIEGDHVSIVLNGAAIPLNPFATRIIRATMAGMVSALKGVRGDRAIERMGVSITR